MSVLPQTTRYFHAGLTRVWWLAGDSVAAPTAADLDAGWEVTGEVADVLGWSVQASLADRPEAERRFVPQSPGSVSVPQSVLTFYADRAAVDARLLLPLLAVGRVVFADAGELAAVDSFPVQVSAVGKARSVAEEPARFDVTFAVLDAPLLDVVVA